MLRDDAVLEIQDGLGFTSLHYDRIVRELQGAQQRLEQGPVRPWFLLMERAYTNTTVNEYRVPVPADFLEENEDGALWFDPTGAPEVELEKNDLDFLLKWESIVTLTDNDPAFYALSGNYFWIFPKPQQIYTIRLSYWHADTVLDSNIENDWLKYAPWLMIGEAGRVIAANARDKKAQDQFDSYRQSGLVLLDTQNQARMHANRDYTMGDSAL